MCRYEILWRSHCPLMHGERRWIDAQDGTFDVELKIKMLDFDSQQYDTEGGRIR